MSPELPRPETCKETAKELQKEPHGKPGTSHAVDTPSPIARGSQIGDESARSRCTPHAAPAVNGGSLKTHTIAHRIHRFSR